MAMVYEYGDAIPKHQTMQGRNVDFLSNKRSIDMGKMLYKGGKYFTRGKYYTGRKILYKMELLCKKKKLYKGEKANQGGKCGGNMDFPSN